MLIKALSVEQREKVYSQLMKRHFHKSELKTFNFIEELISEGKYACYGLYSGKNEELIGYAYFIKREGKPILLLDYFAVLKSFRSHGIGSKFLRQMKKTFSSEYKAVLAEVENPDYALKEEDRHLRKRRIRFYQRNSLTLSNVLSGVSGNEYRIMVLNMEEPLKDDEILEEMKQIYQSTLQKGEELNLRLVENI